MIYYETFISKDYIERKKYLFYNKVKRTVDFATALVYYLLKGIGVDFPTTSQVNKLERNSVDLASGDAISFWCRGYCGYQYIQVVGIKPIIKSKPQLCSRVTTSFRNLEVVSEKSHPTLFDCTVRKLIMDVK